MESNDRRREQAMEGIKNVATHQSSARCTGIDTTRLHMGGYHAAWAGRARRALHRNRNAAKRHSPARFRIRCYHVD